MKMCVRERERKKEREREREREREERERDNLWNGGPSVFQVTIICISVFLSSVCLPPSLYPSLV